MKRTNVVPGVYSHAIQCESKKDGKFLVPVVDVRDGKSAREDAKLMLKQNRRSKFF